MCLTQISEGIPGTAFPVYLSDLNDAEWALLAPLVFRIMTRFFLLRAPPPDRGEDCPCVSVQCLSTLVLCTAHIVVTGCPAAVMLRACRSA
jgi:hypothetical protein